MCMGVGSGCVCAEAGGRRVMDKILILNISPENLNSLVLANFPEKKKYCLFLFRNLL